MARLQNILAGLLLPLLLLSTLTGCSSTVANSVQGNKNQPVALRVGYNNGALVRELFIETAVEKGIFAKYGIKIDAKGYAVGGQVVQDLASGNLDVGLGIGPSPSLAGAAQGVDLKIVASLAKDDSPLVARAGITSIWDLNGKKIGTPGLSSIQETMLNYLERKEGFKAQHIYASPSYLVAFLEKGEIDAIVSWEPVAAQTVSKLSAHYLLDTVIPDAEAAEIIVSGQLFRNHPETIVNLLRAVEETREYLVNHTDERVKEAARLTNLPESVVAESVRRSRLFQVPLQIDMASVKLIISEDIASGKIKGVTPGGMEEFLNKYIDSSLLGRALGN